MKHLTQLAGFNDLKEAAEAIGNLRYDALAELLRHLSGKIHDDGVADRERGRALLAQKLLTAGDAIDAASLHVDDVWHICKPFMEPCDV